MATSDDRRASLPVERLFVSYAREHTEGVSGRDWNHADGLSRFVTGLGAGQFRWNPALERYENANGTALVAAASGTGNVSNRGREGFGGTVFENGGTVRQTRVDQTVRTAVTSAAAFQSFDPFTTTPVQGVHWNYGPTFGTPLNRFAYTTPRTVQFNFGVRF